MIDTRTPNRVPSPLTTVGRLILVRPVFRSGHIVDGVIAHRRDGMHLAQAMFDLYGNMDHVEIRVPIGITTDDKGASVLHWSVPIQVKLSDPQRWTKIVPVELPSASTDSWSWRHVSELVKVTFRYHANPWTKASEIRRTLLTFKENEEGTVKVYQRNDGHCHIATRKCTGFQDDNSMVPHRTGHKGSLSDAELSRRCVKTLGFEAYGKASYRSGLTTREDGWNQMMVALEEHGNNAKNLKCDDCCGVPRKWELRSEPNENWPDWVETYADESAYCVCDNGHSSERTEQSPKQRTHTLAR